MWCEETPTAQQNQHFFFYRTSMLGFFFFSFYKHSASAVFIYLLGCTIKVIHLLDWILVSWWGIGPMPPALEDWSLSHWVTKEVPILGFLYFFQFYFPNICVLASWIVWLLKSWTKYAHPNTIREHIVTAEIMTGIHCVLKPRLSTMLVLSH